MIEQNEALEVARAAGLEIQRKGSHWFALSPFRQERTPSLCFFPDGRWYDFGGGQHGDAADLYAALHKVTLVEALHIVRGEAWKSQLHKPTANDLRRAVEKWRGERWREACKQKHAARAIITTHENTRPNSETFWQAVANEAVANDSLNLLEKATPKQMIRWMGDIL